MSNFFIVLEQIGIFVICACIGIIAVKAKVLSREALHMLSGFVTKILLPLLIFTNTINGTSRSDFFASLSLLLLTTIMYLILYAVFFIISRIMRLKGNRRNIYHACSMFGNCGFIGIPIIVALFPERGGLYIAIYTIIDMLLLWTVGSNLAVPVGEGGKRPLSDKIRKMFNPATIAILLGVVVILTQFKLPEVVNTALTKTGASATPLALIYLGGMLCFIRIGEFLKKAEIYVTIAVKMILLPMLVYTVVSHIPAISSEIAITISVLCGLPSMTSVAMVAETQESDSEYATGMVLMTAIFSIATLPLVCMFASR